MSIIDTDIDTDRRPMIEHKRNKQIPTDKRRIKKTLVYVLETCVEETVKLGIGKQSKKLKTGIYSKTNPIKYIQNTYIPHIQQWTANSNSFY